MTDGRPTLALSVRAPWWWAILHAGKDIENRSWPTQQRGTIYLHAGMWFGRAEVEEDWETIVSIAKQQRRIWAGWPTIPNLRAARGAIVGTVDIVDCVSSSCSPWFFGRYGFVLANPVAFPQPIPCKGALGFFRPDLPPLAPGGAG